MGVTIYKYEVDIDHGLDSLFCVDFGMPYDAQLLTAAESPTQDPRVCAVWARVDPSRPVMRRRVFIIGTGGACPARIEAAHVASYVASDGHVWHVFDGGERRDGF